MNRTKWRSRKLEMELVSKASPVTDGMSEVCEPEWVVVPKRNVGPDLSDVLWKFRTNPEASIKDARARSRLRSEAENFPRPWLPEAGPIDRSQTEKDRRAREAILARWRRPWWEDLCVTLRDLKPSGGPAANLPVPLAERMADCLAGYTLNRELSRAVPKRVKKFFRRLVRNITQGRNRPGRPGNRHKLKTKIVTLMMRDLLRYGYEPEYAAAIVARSLELIGETYSPTTVGRVARRFLRLQRTN